MGAQNSKTNQINTISNKELIASIIKLRYQENKQYLDLDNNVQDWQDVLLAKNWSKLKKLRLAHCGISDDSINIFIKLSWSQLTQLYLSYNKFTFRGMQSMVNCNIQNLKELFLLNNSIGNHGVKYLVRMNLPNLHTLWISQCKIGSLGIKHLTKARWLHLNSLILEYGSKNSAYANKIQLNGWEMIHQNNFPSIKYLYVKETQPICWLRCVLVQKQDFGIKNVEVEKENEEMHQQINRILQDRNISKENLKVIRR